MHVIMQTVIIVTDFFRNMGYTDIYSFDASAEKPVANVHQVEQHA